MAFYVAENNPARREQTAEGNGCFYLMGNRTKGNSWVISDRDKGAAAPAGKTGGSALTLGQVEMKLVGEAWGICQASVTLTERREGGRERRGEICISTSQELLLKIQSQGWAMTQWSVC